MVISGAFKFRGASNAIFSLNDEQATKGVVTHSRYYAMQNIFFLNFPISLSLLTVQDSFITNAEHSICYLCNNGVIFLNIKKYMFEYLTFSLVVFDFLYSSKLAIDLV